METGQAKSPLKDAKFLEQALRVSPQAVYIYDQTANRLTYATENISKTLGYTLEELQAMPEAIISVMHPEDVGKVRDSVRLIRRCADEEQVETVFRIRHKDGRYRWLRTTDMPYTRDSSGRVSSTIGFTTDITTEMKAVLAMERSSRANAFLLQTAEVLSDTSRAYPIVLDSLAALASRYFDAVCEIVTLERDGRTLRPLAVHHRDEAVCEAIRMAYTKSTLRVGDGMAGAVIGSGKELFQQEAAEELRNKVRRFNPILTPESFIYCPMQSPKGVLGTLNIIRLEGEGPITEDELLIIRRLASNAALFLDNAQLREEQQRELEQRRRTQAELHYTANVNSFLVTVSRILSDLGADHRETLQKLIERVSLHFNAYAVMYLRNGEQEAPEPLVYYHRHPEVMDALRRSFEEKGKESGIRAAGDIISSGRPYIANGERAQERKGRRMDPALDPSAFGFWPVIGAEAKGALGMARTLREPPFTDDELSRIHQLTGYISVFIDNMLLADRQRKELEARRQAEERLAQLESDLRNILNAIPVNIARINADLTFSFINDSYRKMGFSSKVIGRSVTEVIGQEWADGMMPMIKRALRGEVVTMEESFRLPSGRLGQFSTVLAPDYDHNGTLTGFYYCSVDVTARVEAEQHLKLSEGRYRSLLLNSGDAFCLHRLSGEIIEVNHFATLLLGYSRAELLSMNIRQIEPIWESDVYPRRLERVAPDVPMTLETDVIHKNGSRVPVEVRFVKRLENGEVLIQALVRDRTEKRLQEQQIKRSEERLKAIIDNLEDVIMTLKPDGTILSISAPQHGYTQEEVVGTKIYSYMDKRFGTDARKRIKHAMRSGESFEILERGWGDDGSVNWFLTRYCPVREEGILVTISRNITHLKETEFRELRAMSQGQEQERRRLGAELHDGIGQVMSSIALELSQIRASADEGMAVRLHDLSARVHEAMQEVRNISHDLMPGVLESFGLSEAIRETCESLQDRTGKRIIYDAIDTDDSRYPGDVCIHLFRIAQELLSNCTRHSEAPQLNVSLIDHGKVLSLSVEDNGIGFDTEAPRNGIGLRNVESRAKLLNGSVNIDSRQGRGAMVHVEVPLSLAPPTVKASV